MWNRSDRHESIVSACKRQFVALVYEVEPLPAICRIYAGASDEWLGTSRQEDLVVAASFVSAAFSVVQNTLQQAGGELTCVSKLTTVAPVEKGRRSTELVEPSCNSKYFRTASTKASSSGQPRRVRRPTPCTVPSAADPNGAYVFETEEALVLRELLTERLFELRGRATHPHVMEQEMNAISPSQDCSSSSADATRLGGLCRDSRQVPTISRLGFRVDRTNYRTNYPD